MGRDSSSGVVRIIGGRWKRTPLQVLDREDLRPTPDRVRETLFNWLAHHFAQSFEGVSVLDLFAGSGALGLEAASRGAAPVVLVELSGPAARQLRAQVSKLAAESVVAVREESAAAAVKRFQSQKKAFDLVLLDPPFAGAPAVEVLTDALPVCGDLVYVEAPRKLDPAQIDRLGLTIRRSDRAGAVFYHLLQRKNNEETGDASRNLSRDV